MQVNLIHNDVGADAFRIISNELLKINCEGIDIVTSEEPRKADINYWISYGFYIQFAERQKMNNSHLVFF